MRSFIIAVVVLTILTITTGVLPAMDYNWYETEKYHFVYSPDGKRMIAEVYAGDNASWVWVVYIKTSFGDRPYSDVVCCKDEAFAEVKRILLGGYWI